MSRIRKSHFIACQGSLALDSLSPPDRLYRCSMLHIDRHPKKAIFYRKVLNFCFNPKCDFGYGMQTHHIIPISKGGDDQYHNYIVLCAKCHNLRGIHTEHSKRQIEFLTYKFYYEKWLLGITSDDCSELTFHNALMEFSHSPKNAHDIVFSV